MIIETLIKVTMLPNEDQANFPGVFADWLTTELVTVLENVEYNKRSEIIMKIVASLQNEKLLNENRKYLDTYLGQNNIIDIIEAIL